MTSQRLRLVFVAVLTMAASACQSSPPSPEPTATPPAPSTPSTPPAASSSPPGAPSPSTAPAALTRVTDPSLVCMVNDQFMGKPQIPVDVGGKTYFGCCPMCKEKLEQQAAARTGTDLVTGEPVDKATAVIAQNADGSVLYFASETNFKAYASKL
jgi:YHS domain-containing protein